MTADVLPARALNRTLLDRQLLRRRRAMPVLDAVGHLVGLQAQVPVDPYVGLWSRLDGFRPEELSGLMEDRAVVRIVVMRGTIHLVTADDCLLLRPLAQPVLDAELERHRDFAPLLAGVDLAPVLDVARPLLTEPRTLPQIRAALAERFPEPDPAALAYACRNHLALVQVPPRGLWGRSAQVTLATAESWLGRPPVAEPPLDEVVLRYLAAFGPATPADVGAWSGLTGMRAVLDRLRPRLRAFRDERGRELLDVPDAPLPDPDTPAPVRFLPTYDNVALSHADRSRILAEDDRKRLFAATERVQGSVLHDGFVRATWRIERDDRTGAAALVVRHVGELAGPAADAVAEEGHRLLGLLVPEATGRDVRLVPVE